MTAYIDTSVLVAYYCPEAISPKVQKALSKSGQAFISPLVEVEFCSAVAAKVRAKELDVAAARPVLSLFQKHLAGDYYGIVPIDSAAYRLARDWIAEFSTSLRAPDAIHLAAAFANELLLLTADKGLARSAAHFGVACELIA